MPIGISDPRQYVGLADTVSSPQQEVNWSDPYAWGGTNWTATTPSQQQQAFDWQSANGVNPMARDTLDYTSTAFNNWAGANQDWLKSQGYTGAMPGAGAGTLSQDLSNPGAGSGDLEGWLNQNGYKFGTAQYNHSIAGNVFDKYGNPVGSGPVAGARTGYDWGWTIPVAMFAGGAALAGQGLGGAGVGEAASTGAAGTSAAPGGFDFAATYGAPASATGPGVQLAAGPGFTGLGETAASTGVDLGAGGATAGDFGMNAAGGFDAAAGAGAGGGTGLMSQAGQLWDKYSGLFGGAKGLGNIIGSGMNIYNQSKAQKGLQDIINQSKIGPDSPYAKQLREELMRKDAAAGRRSDYGSREVQLEAQLAKINSQNLPSLLQAQQGLTGAGSSSLNSLLNIGQNVNWGDLAKTVGGWFGG